MSEFLSDLTADDGSSPLRIASLHIYPVKSCAGITLDQALLADTGLDRDRQWMVIDAQGLFVSQRETPRMALIQVSLKNGEAVLRAPGMLALHLPLDAAEDPLAVQVWDDRLNACGMGRVADQWLSDFLGRPLRLARFDPGQQRLSSRRWTGELAAANLFSDGYPILVTSTASLADLNRRLAERGQPAVTMARFRPNLVLDGVDAYAEDHLDELHIDTPDGPVTLRLVKPCARCPIPNTDPLTAERGDEPGLTLAGYRADARLDGAITFGMNAVIVAGIDCRLKVGQKGRGMVRF